MIDLDHDPYLGLALRDRLESELPDLEHLASASLATGQKVRRRRRVAVGAGTAAAGIAAIALATSTLGAGGTTARDAEVAESSTAEPATAGTTVTADPDKAAGLPTGAPRATGLPVSVDAPGWSCESFPVDEKMWCQSGDLGVSVVVRGADDYDGWKGSADKEGSALWMSPVHGNYFVTLQGGGNGLTPAQLDTFINGIAFADTWQRP